MKAKNAENDDEEDENEDETVGREERDSFT